MKRVDEITPAGETYALLDCGEGEKLERYGNFVLARPDPQALWPKSLEKTTWDDADAVYNRNGKDGEWTIKKPLPEQWPVQFGGFTFLIRPTSFKHTGLFPEQLANWQWIKNAISEASDREVRVLNLFAYTGGVSLAAAEAGAQVTHVDASKTAIAWAKENAVLSGLAEKPIRWITEDVLTFVEREVRRGSHYDLIVMDPPAFGRGPDGQVWKIEEHFLQLLEHCRALLSERPLGIVMSGYAAGYAPLAFAYNLEETTRDLNGSIEYGELHIAVQGSAKELPCGIFARWAPHG